jgi:pyridoxamine 5'-phosphate oxidase
MDANALFEILDRILESSRVGILATIDADGKPRMRWMTPTVVRGREGFLYAVTSPEFDKAVQLRDKPDVEWMLQSKALDEILTIRGKIQLVDNPSAKSDVQEALGGNLGTFWRINPDETKLIVLETIIEKMVYFKPITGEKVTVDV